MTYNVFNFSGTLNLTQSISQVSLLHVITKCVLIIALGGSVSSVCFHLLYHWDGATEIPLC